MKWMSVRVHDGWGHVTHSAPPRKGNLSSSAAHAHLSFIVRVWYMQGDQRAACGSRAMSAATAHRPVPAGPHFDAAPSRDRAGSAAASTLAAKEAPVVLIDRHNPQHRYQKGKFLGKVTHARPCVHQPSTRDTHDDTRRDTSTARADTPTHIALAGWLCQVLPAHRGRLEPTMGGQDRREEDIDQVPRQGEGGQ
jgi:hypothetical protein